jgi:RHS repeat-associated protein
VSSWQGPLLTGYTISSAWEGGGTAYGAAYDADGHLSAWNAAATGALGSATQKFNENYTLSLENYQQISSVNSLGRTTTAAYNYTDSSSKERVTSILTPSMPTGDYFSYDRRGRGLITMHCISSTAPSQQPCSSVQNPPQDSYQYDVQDRLISISHLGSKLEDLSYDAAGRLVGRAFPSAPNTPDSARYYVGDDLTVVVGSSQSPRTVGYVHVRLGGKRVASIWAKSVGSTSTNGTIYYHRDNRSSVVATTTAGGNIGISYRYLPSGAVDKVVGTEADETASELGFIGGTKLSGGLVHLRARAYSPLLRRFLQPDTIDLRRYTYAHGDPLNFVDPTGRDGVGASQVNQPVNPEVRRFEDAQLNDFSFSIGGRLSMLDTSTIDGYVSPGIVLAVLIGDQGSGAASAASSDTGSAPNSGSGGTKQAIGYIGSSGGAQYMESTSHEVTDGSGTTIEVSGILHPTKLERLQASLTAIDITLAFFGGGGPRRRTFGSRSAESQVLRTSSGYQHILAYYLGRSALAGKLLAESHGVNYEADNPLTSMLGQYTVYFSPVDNTNVLVSAYNNTSLTSFGHGTFDGSNELPEIRGSGPGSSIIETFFWWERVH